MQCSHVQRRLSAYLDHETAPDETRRIAEHLGSCAVCAAELSLLESAGARVKELSPVRPSPDFRARFWERARGEEEKSASPSLMDTLVRRWLPVPVLLAFAVIAFSGFTVFSPLLFAAAGQAAENRAVILAKNTFAGFSGRKILGPLNYIDFCNDCHSVLCGPCCEGKNGECRMGENHD